MNKLVRSVGIMSAAVAFGAGSALVAPMAGAQGSSFLGSLAPDTCGESIVTPSGLADAGWGTPGDETPAEIAAVEDAGEAVGDAALTFGAPATGKPGVSLYKNGNDAPLSSLIVNDKPINMSYDYVASAAGPALQIRILGANLYGVEEDNIGFATIVHEPANSDGTWKTAKPGEGDEFWVTRAIEGVDGEEIDRYTMMSLEEIVALNPEATISAYGVNKSNSNPSTDVAVDNFTFDCEVTDFELDPEDGGLFGSVTGIFQS